MVPFVFLKLLKCLLSTLKISKLVRILNIKPRISFLIISKVRKFKIFNTNNLWINLKGTQTVFAAIMLLNCNCINDVIFHLSFEAYHGGW